MDNSKLIAIIKDKIDASLHHSIPFHDYMELCLYHPEYGYYCNEREKVGKGGDFYTSSSIGGLFGEVLARYVAVQARLHGSTKPLTCVEWGGGTGDLARQLLDELKTNFSDVYERVRYLSIELSSHHRSKQAGNLREHVAAGRVEWMNEQQWLASSPWSNTIVFSNELIDAFPVHLVQVVGDEPMEVAVSWDVATDMFMETLIPIPKASPLLAYLANIQQLNIPLRSGQRLEVNIEAVQWLKRVGRAIGNGQLVSIDYGDCAQEVYAEHRMNGTLMCYQQHRAMDDPYQAPGQQDMTAHVNFSVLAQAGDEAGLASEQLLTQKQFLVDNGLLDKLQNTTSMDPFSPAARRNRAVRQLLLSDRMSELFKVLIQKKGEPL